MQLTNTSLFFQIPQHTLTMDNLSNNDRMVLGLITDRHNLSKSNNTTHDGRICLYYTRKSIATDAGLCEKTVIKSIKKLKMYGLIEETRQGQGKANIIYLVTPQTLDNHKNCKNSTSKTVKNTEQELEKVQRNNTKLNNTKLNNKDDDAPKQNKVVSQKEESSSIDEKGVIKYLEAYNKAMGSTYILTHTQEIAITKLINKYGIDNVLKAVSNIKGNEWLIANNTPAYFITKFIKILNNEYRDKKLNQSQKPIIKKTRFNYMNSRTWDFEELDRLEDEYIDRKLAGSDFEEDIASLGIGGVKLDTVSQKVGTETVEQVRFSANQNLTARQIEIKQLYGNEPYTAYTAGKITREELDFLWMYR